MNATVIRSARRMLLPVGVFSIPVCLLVLAFLALQFACGHPSDTRLARRFYSHESEFNELVRMTEIDSPVYRIASDFSLPANRRPFQPAWNFKGDCETPRRRLNIVSGEYQRIAIWTGLFKGLRVLPQRAVSMRIRHGARSL